MPVYNQHLSPVELKALWHLQNPHVIWMEESPIIAFWCTLINLHPDIAIGPPLDNEQMIEIEGVKIFGITCTSGRRILYFQASGRTILY